MKIISTTLLLSAISASSATVTLTEDFVNNTASDANISKAYTLADGSNYDFINNTSAFGAAGSNRLILDRSRTINDGFADGENVVFRLAITNNNPMVSIILGNIVFDYAAAAAVDTQNNTTGTINTGLRIVGDGTNYSYRSANSIAGGGAPFRVAGVDQDTNPEIDLGGLTIAAGETVNIDFDYNSSANDSISFFNSSVLTYDTVAIPEPTSVALLGLGGLTLMLRRKR